MVGAKPNMQPNELFTGIPPSYLCPMVSKIATVYYEPTDLRVLHAFQVLFKYSKAATWKRGGHHAPVRCGGNAFRLCLFEFEGLRK